MTTSLCNSLDSTTFVGACLGLGLLAACAKRAPSAPPPAPEPHPLQGTWEGYGDSGEVSITVEGNSLYFHARDDFQYDTTFELVAGTDPAELRATILDSPRTTDSVGEVVVAIYRFEDGTLHLAAVDKPDGEPGSFDRSISKYRLERAQARE